MGWRDGGQLVLAVAPITNVADLRQKSRLAEAHPFKPVGLAGNHLILSDFGGWATLTWGTMASLKALGESWATLRLDWIPTNAYLPNRPAGRANSCS